MKSITIKANITLGPILFWITLLILFYVFFFVYSWPVLLGAMGVMLFPYQMLLISFTKYEFTNKEIIIHQAFSKNVIPIETIRNTAKKESRFLKKVLVAAPKETTTIQYNKYDSAELFLSEKQIQSLLQ